MRKLGFFLFGLLCGLSLLPTHAQYNGTTGRNYVKTASVPFSATPIFDASQGTQLKITLTGNVTSSTFVNASDGGIYTLKICQDSSGLHTFVYPANILGAVVIGSVASTCTTQVIVWDAATSHGLAISTGLTGLAP